MSTKINRVKLMREAAEVPEERYTRGRNVARLRLDGYVSARALAREMGRGASLVCFSVDDWSVPPQTEGELGSALRCRTQLTVFVTPPNGQG